MQLTKVVLVRGGNEKKKGFANYDNLIIKESLISLNVSGKPLHSVD